MATTAIAEEDPSAEEMPVPFEVLPAGNPAKISAENRRRNTLKTSTKLLITPKPTVMKATMMMPIKATTTTMTTTLPVTTMNATKVTDPTALERMEENPNEDVEGNENNNKDEGDQDNNNDDENNNNDDDENNNTITEVGDKKKKDEVERVEPKASLVSNPSKVPVRKAKSCWEPGDKFLSGSEMVFPEDGNKNAIRNKDNVSNNNNNSPKAVKSLSASDGRHVGWRRGGDGVGNFRSAGASTSSSNGFGFRRRLRADSDARGSNASSSEVNFWWKRMSTTTATKNFNATEDWE